LRLGGGAARAADWLRNCGRGKAVTPWGRPWRGAEGAGRPVNMTPCAGMEERLPAPGYAPWRNGECGGGKVVTPWGRPWRGVDVAARPVDMTPCAGIAEKLPARGYAPWGNSEWPGPYDPPAFMDPEEPGVVAAPTDCIRCCIRS